MPRGSTRRDTSRPNQLLLAVPPAERAVIEGSGVRVSLRPKQILYRQGERVDRVYLLESGAVSLLSVMLDGRCAEVGLVGCEGAVGLVCGLDVMPCEAVVQAGGNALVVSSETLRQNAERNGQLSELLCLHHHALLLQAMQNVACHKLHTVTQRAARWILTLQDRTRSSLVPLTQEALGTMLGVRRQSVNAVAQRFQSEGIIGYRHGRMVVLQRATLEAMSCECHAVVRTYVERIFTVQGRTVADRTDAGSSELEQSGRATRERRKSSRRTSSPARERDRRPPLDGQR